MDLLFYNFLPPPHTKIEGRKITAIQLVCKIWDPNNWGPKNNRAKKLGAKKLRGKKIRGQKLRGEILKEAEINCPHLTLHCFKFSI